MIFDILTIFPAIFDSYVKESLLGKAREENLLEINFHDLRNYTKDKHKQVDDRPFGGGPGMVLKIEPIVDCLESIKPKDSSSKEKKTKTVLLGPRGKEFVQKKVQEYSKLDRLVLIAGRYEGVDERVKEFIDEEVSIGDYILSGGELPAMVVVEAVSRLLPGVVGNQESIKDKGYPVYTKPREFRGLKVPEVLLSGHHQKIKKWRQGE